MESRRKFITKSMLALGATALASCSGGENNRKKPDNGKKISVGQDCVILFQGDSITDAWRNRENPNPNDLDAMGKGYPVVAGGDLLGRFAEKDIKVYNRGISGNRVPDLIARWQTDTVDLRPNILSILIGVNDFWRTKDSGAENTPEQYKGQYRQLLDETFEKLPDVKVIVCEPFGVKNVKYVTDDWYPEFPKYQQAAKEIAAEFDTLFLPYQSIFDKAEERAPGSFWTTDGVHTSLAGANLMAQSWLQLVG